MITESEFEQVLDMLDDARLILAPLGAQGLWMHLAIEMRENPETKGFQLGSVGLNQFLTSVSQYETGNETDKKNKLETYLEYLTETGLVKRNADGSVEIPGIAASTDRSAIARENGARGGRPRRGESAEQAAARRAREPMAPPPRGDLETRENQTGKTRLARAAAAAERKSLGLQAAGATGQVTFGRAVARLAGFEDGCDIRPVLDWLEHGIDRDVIVQTVRKVSARSGYKAPRSLRYFSEAISEAAPPGRSTPGDLPSPAAHPPSKRPRWWSTWVKRLAGRHDAPGVLPSDHLRHAND